MSDEIYNYSREAATICDWRNYCGVMIVYFYRMKRYWPLFFVFLFLGACELDSPSSNVTRLDYLGSWTCNEFEGDFAPQMYTVEVESFGGTNEVKIFGFYNIGNGDAVKAEALGTTLFIFNQTVDGITFRGTGIMQPDLSTIDFEFTADDGGGIDNVKATWTR